MRAEILKLLPATRRFAGGFRRGSTLRPDKANRRLYEATPMLPNHPRARQLGSIFDAV